MAARQPLSQSVPTTGREPARSPALQSGSAEVMNLQSLTWLNWQTDLLRSLLPPTDPQWWIQAVTYGSLRTDAHFNLFTEIKYIYFHFDGCEPVSAHVTSTISNLQVGALRSESLSVDSKVGTSFYFSSLHFPESLFYQSKHMHVRLPGDSEV